MFQWACSSSQNVSFALSGVLIQAGTRGIYSCLLENFLPPISLRYCLKLPFQVCTSADYLKLFDLARKTLHLVSSLLQRCRVKLSRQSRECLHFQGSLQLSNSCLPSTIVTSPSSDRGKERWLHQGEYIRSETSHRCPWKLCAPHTTLWERVCFSHGQDPLYV